MKKLILIFIAASATMLLSQTKPTDTDGDGFLNISTLDELRWLSESEDALDEKFELDNDIDASGTRNWNVGDHDADPETPDSAMGWKPIGEFIWWTHYNDYDGEFDGKGHVIKNLYINSPDSNYVGFFSILDSGAVVKNLSFENAHITGKTSGILAGAAGFNSYKKRVLIDNCHAHGIVKGGGIFAGSVFAQVSNCSSSGVSYGSGGFCGYSNYADFVNCFNTADVYSKGYAGGFAGRVDGGSIDKCFSTGNVKGKINVGGFAGKISEVDTFSNCYSKGVVQGDSLVGGFCGTYEGELYDNEEDVLYNCYTVSSVRSSYMTGGFAAKSDHDTKHLKTIFTNSFWNVETSGAIFTAGGFELTNEQMKDKNTYAGWDFDSTWVINPDINDGYPHLKGLPAFESEIVYPLYPTNLEIIKDNTPKFKWTEVNDYDSYHFQLSTDPDFNILLKDISLNYDHYQYIQKLEDSSTYYWRVRYTKDGNNSDWTPVSQFTIIKDYYSKKPIDKDNDSIYNISELSHFIWIKDHPYSLKWNYELDNDIDASDTKNWNIGDHDNDPKTPDEPMGWEPLGDVLINIEDDGYIEKSFHKTFIGLLNGKGHTISNLYINRTGFNYIGFFSNLDNEAKIENLHITNADIEGNNFCGILTGSMHINEDIDSIDIEINNCSTSGNINGNEKIGGLCGYAYFNDYYGDIETKALINCSSSAKVTGTDRIGGLVGYLVKTDLINCSFEGEVRGSKYVGGLAGDSRIKDITGCSVNADIYGNENVGGLLGFINGTGIIKDCNTNCTVKGDSVVGGFIGYSFIDNMNIRLYVVVENCSSKSKVEGINNVGGFCGYNNGLILYDCLSESEVRGKNYVGGFSGIHVNSYTGIPLTLYATTKSCINKGSVKGQDYVGGLFGFLGGIKRYEIDKCYNIGSVEGNNYVGGFCGSNSYMPDTEYKYGFAKVRNSYNKGPVSGDKFVGGFCGTNFNSFYNSYNVGKIHGNSSVGGFCAINNDKAGIYSCFFDIQTSGIETSAGGRGLPTSLMKESSTFIEAGWDFDSTWSIHPDINDGYPYLQGSPVSVNEHSVFAENDDLLLYPNPAGDVLHIKMENKKINAGIDIYNALGIRLLSTSIRDRIDISELPAGIYYLRIGEQSGRFVKK